MMDYTDHGQTNQSTVWELDMVDEISSILTSHFRGHPLRKEGSGGWEWK